MIEVRDNFLSENELQFVKQVIFADDFQYSWYDKVVGNETNKELHTYFLVHLLYDNKSGASKFYPILNAIFKNKLEIKELLRMKVNLYPQNDNLYEHGYHIDRDEPHKGALFSLNTCDGYTKFETGEKIESVENRIILFDPSVLHTSTNTTNEQRRVNINFNYF